MPVTVTETVATYAGNGSTTTPYAITVPRDQDADLVLLVDEVVSTDFTVSTDGFRTGVAHASTVALVLYRSTPKTQIQPFPSNTTPAAEDVRQALDKITYSSQELGEEVARSVKAMVGETFGSSTSLGYNATGRVVARTTDEEVVFLGIGDKVTEAAASAAAADVARIAAEAVPTVQQQVLDSRVELDGANIPDAKPFRESINITSISVMDPDYGALGDAVEFADGQITSGSSSFTSNSGAFTAADIGKILFIRGAGFSGEDFNSIISSITSTTIVALQDDAETTVSGAIGCYGTDDTAAIQLALDYALANRVTCRVPDNRTFLIGSTFPNIATNHLRLTPGYGGYQPNTFAFVGGVKSKLLSFHDGVTFFAINGFIQDMALKRIQFKVIASCGDNKTGIGQLAGGSQSAGGMKNALIEGCQFEGFSRSIYLNGCKDVRIKNNIFGAPWGHATADTDPNVYIWADNGNNGLCRDITITGNIFDGYTGSNGLATDNPIYTAPMDGAIYGEIDGAIISGNKTQNFEYEHIYLAAWPEVEATKYNKTLSITSGDATLTSTETPFASTDAGKTILVIGAGVAGGDLWTTIASVTTTSAVELTDNAVTTLSGSTGWAGWGQPKESRPLLISGNLFDGRVPDGIGTYVNYACRVDGSHALITGNKVLNCIHSIHSRTQGYRHEGTVISGNFIEINDDVQTPIDSGACIQVHTEITGPNEPTGGLRTRWNNGLVIADNSVFLNYSAALTASRYGIIDVARVKNGSIRNNRVLLSNHTTGATHKFVGFEVDNCHDTIISNNEVSGADSYAYVNGSTGISITAPIYSDLTDTFFQSGSQTANLFLRSSQAADPVVTAAATVGAQTIDRDYGSVNFAAAATSLVVTNNLVTAASIINVSVATVDTSMKSVVVVAGDNNGIAAVGKFTLTANAAANAETRVNFQILS
jgi:hypothetical protein